MAHESSISRYTYKQLAFVAMILASSGCTRSFPTTYVPGEGIAAVSPAGSQTIAIAQFEDKRSFAQRRDKNATSYIATQSPWMFGLTHKGKTYIPVNALVQDLFVSEFISAGLKAVASDVTSSDPAVLHEAARTNHTDYALGGQILAFEFVNDVGVWTVTSRRAVTMSITLVPATGDALLSNTMMSSSDAEGEGMGVMHTTNVEKLMNGTFKNVLNQVIAAVATKLALMPSDIDVKLTYGGRVMRFPATSLL